MAHNLYIPVWGVVRNEVVIILGGMVLKTVNIIIGVAMVYLMRSESSC